MKYLDILKKNKILSCELKDKGVYKIFMLSNIVVNQIKDILEVECKIKGINACVSFGDYDNIVKESVDNNSDCVIIFWEFDNIVEGFGYKFDSIDKPKIDSLEQQIKSSINLVFNNLSKTPVVFFNKFSSLSNESFVNKSNNLNSFIDRLNKFVVGVLPSNVILIDVNSIKSIASMEKSVDYRLYNLSKSPYTVAYFINYAKYILPVISSLNGKSKKALIFDCDNTLWGGVIGEDGMDGIKISDHGEGKFYSEVQYLTKTLIDRGVIIGLCSKNNPEDVKQVFNNHKNMVLSSSDVAIEKINWDDKVENLINISNELNIGIDSMVFIDDSSFEINNINERLPEICTFQVPKNIYKYPLIFREIMSLFYSHSTTLEDKNKTSYYAAEKIRKNSIESYKDMTMYLKSLNLNLKTYIDSFTQVPRISQLTQKTNQFNLTTKRYSEKDIKAFVNSDKYVVYTFYLSDNFGDYGLTGLCIVELRNEYAYVDSFLMSCRVIGRNVEYNFFDYIVNNLSSRGFKEVFTDYVKTTKNEQVESFWDDVGFNHCNYDAVNYKYNLLIDNYNSRKLSYIKIVEYEK